MSISFSMTGISGIEIISNIIVTLFIWLIISMCYFIYRYTRHLRAERNRFLTMEPDFQNFDNQHGLESSTQSQGLLGKLIRILVNPTGNVSLKLKLPQNLSKYKACAECGTLSIKNEVFCITCGSHEFFSS